MKIAYSRISTTDQNPNPQQDALQQAGCDKIAPKNQNGKTAICDFEIGTRNLTMC